MALTEGFDENADPSYCEQLKLLEDSLEAVEDWETAFCCLEKFAKEYLMPWKVGEMFYE